MLLRLVLDLFDVDLDDLGDNDDDVRSRCFLLLLFGGKLLSMLLSLLSILLLLDRSSLLL